MVVKNVLKRILPFLLTFILGIFVAGLFVKVSAPLFPSENRVKTSCWTQKKQMKAERMRERERQRQMRNQPLEEIVPPPPIEVAPAAPAPTN